MSINNRAHIVYMSPPKDAPNGHFHDVNVLGMHFLRTFRARLEVDLDSDAVELTLRT